MADTPKPCSDFVPQVKLADIRAASADVRAEAYRLSLLAEGVIRWSAEGHAYRQFPRWSVFTSLPMPSVGIKEAAPGSSGLRSGRSRKATGPVDAPIDWHPGVVTTLWTTNFSW